MVCLLAERLRSSRRILKGKRKRKTQAGLQALLLRIAYRSLVSLSMMGQILFTVNLRTCGQAAEVSDVTAPRGQVAGLQPSL